MSETQVIDSREELPGMPELDSTAKKAIEILDRADELNKIQDVKKNLEEHIHELRHELAEMLHATGRERIKVEGVLFEVKHVPEDTTVTMKRDPGTKKKKEQDETEEGAAAQEAGSDGNGTSDSQTA